MRVLLAGAWEYPIYEEACAGALEEEGVEVLRHEWASHFRGLPGRIERKWTLPGWGTYQLNTALLEAVRRERPEVVWLWRATHVFPTTLKKISDLGALIVGHNNDDSFSPRYLESRLLFERRMWVWFNPGLPYYDLQLAFRGVNVREYLAVGCPRVEMFPPYYRDGLDRKLDLPEAELAAGASDLIFIGHHEDDGREQALRRLADEGFLIRLHGDQTWRKSGGEERMKPVVGQITPVYGEDYVRALNRASIALCFLSKRHRDPWTRRCFEIPACGTMLLSERTPELQEVFLEGKEAEYFGDEDELVDKARFYLSHPEDRERIAAAGHERVKRDGHGVRARMRWLKGCLEELMHERHEGTGLRKG